MAHSFPHSGRVVADLNAHPRDRAHTSADPLPGVERAVIDNGGSDAYWHFHAKRDHQRHHAALHQEQFTTAA